MNSQNMSIVVILILVVLFAVIGTAIGIVFYRNNIEDVKKEEDLYLTLEDMYCNIKESKKILKLKVTIEVSNKKTYENLDEKRFLIRDEINKTVRNKAEDELQGREGQLNLQKEIKNKLVNLFDDDNIKNVYFDDLIIQ